MILFKLCFTTKKVTVLQSEFSLFFNNIAPFLQFVRGTATIKSGFWFYNNFKSNHRVKLKTYLQILINYTTFKFFRRIPIDHVVSRVRFPPKLQNVCDLWTTYHLVPLIGLQTFHASWTNIGPCKSTDNRPLINTPPITSAVRPAKRSG